jgi:hypothetical protein
MHCEEVAERWEGAVFEKLEACLTVGDAGEEAGSVDGEAGQGRVEERVLKRGGADWLAKEANAAVAQGGRTTKGGSGLIQRGLLGR